MLKGSLCEGLGTRGGKSFSCYVTTLSLSGVPLLNSESKN